MSSIRESVDEVQQKMTVALAPLVSRYQRLSSLEHLIVLALFWLVMIVLLLVLVVMPIYRWQNEKSQFYQSQLDLVTWMKSHAQVFEGQSGGSVPNGQSLQTLVIRDANRSKIKLQRYEPKGQTELRVWINQVTFKDLLGWIQSMQQRYGIRVVDISVEHKPNVSGSVKATIVFSL